MGLNAIFSFFVPKDKKFFPLFEQAGENLIEMAALLQELVNCRDTREIADLTLIINQLEQKGDSITHKIHLELGKNFITPFDREDIHSLANSLDDVADYIYGAAKKIHVYKISETIPPMESLTKLIVDCCEQIQFALLHLKNMKNAKLIADANIIINSAENKADDIYNDAIADLFEKEKDAIRLIKYKEVLSTMENATDKCEDVSNVFESILVKNA